MFIPSRTALWAVFVMLYLYCLVPCFRRVLEFWSTLCSTGQSIAEAIISPLSRFAKSRTAIYSWNHLLLPIILFKVHCTVVSNVILWSTWQCSPLVFVFNIHLRKICSLWYSNGDKIQKFLCSFVLIIFLLDYIWQCHKYHPQLLA